MLLAAAELTCFVALLSSGHGAVVTDSTKAVQEKSGIQAVENTALVQMQDDNIYDDCNGPVRQQKTALWAYDVEINIIRAKGLPDNLPGKWFNSDVADAYVEFNAELGTHNTGKGMTKWVSDNVNPTFNKKCLFQVEDGTEDIPISVKVHDHNKNGREHTLIGTADVVSSFSETRRKYKLKIKCVEDSWCKSGDPELEMTVEWKLDEEARSSKTFYLVIVFVCLLIAVGAVAAAALHLMNQNQTQAREFDGGQPQYGSQPGLEMQGRPGGPQYDFGIAAPTYPAQSSLQGIR